MPRDPKQHESEQWNKIEKKILRCINEPGWFVMNVVPKVGDEGLGWSYSIGLFYNYQHPEILIFGEDADLRHAMIMAASAQPISYTDAEHQSVQFALRSFCAPAFGRAVRRFGQLPIASC